MGIVDTSQSEGEQISLEILIQAKKFKKNHKQRMLWGAKKSWATNLCLIQAIDSNQKKLCMVS